MKKVCLYHANCTDGFTAAWAVQRRFPDIELVAVAYGDTPPNVEGDIVIIVDFSYPPETLKAMNAHAISVLDHHKTAEEQLRSIPAPPSQVNGADIAPRTKEYLKGEELVSDIAWALKGGIYAQFDMSRSGAKMAWDFFHQGEDDSFFVLMVQDRDLWRFELSYTKLLHTFVNLQEHTIDRFNYYHDLCSRPHDMRQTLDPIVHVHEYHMKQVRDVIASNAREIPELDHTAVFVNAPAFMASDIGEILGHKYKWVAVYWDTKTHRDFSLRSRGDFDVSEVAKVYDGGGHKHSAGFRVPRNNMLASI